MTMRRDPFGMFDEMERLFENARAAAGETGRGASNLDLEESEGGYVVLADLPGFEREEIDLTFDEGYLSVRADHEVERPSGTRTRRVRESIRVPGEVEDEGIEATYRNGVLEVTLPIAADGRRGGHRIDVE